MDSTGFFIDWDGDTRRFDQPGDGYSCGTITNVILGGKTYQMFDVLDSDGFVIFEAVYYKTLDDIKAIGITVNLVD